MQDTMRHKPHFVPAPGGWLCRMPSGEEEWGPSPREALVAATRAKLRGEAREHRRALRAHGWKRGMKKPPGAPQWTKTS
jgi:hypothetical protein